MNMNKKVKPFLRGKVETVSSHSMSLHTDKSYEDLDKQESKVIPEMSDEDDNKVTLKIKEQPEDMSPIKKLQEKVQYKQSREQKIMWVKKNLKEQTAALMYSCGVSIVHLAIFISFHFTEKIDLASTTNLSIECQQEAGYWNRLLNSSYWVHLLLFFNNLYKETFSASTDHLGQVMRIVEIVCILMYVYQILISLELLCISMIRWEIRDEYPLRPERTYML